MTTAVRCPEASQHHLDRSTAVRARTQLPALVAGDVVDAIAMPAAFGEFVQAELRIMMLAGQVIAGPDGSWTFLTGLANVPAPDVPTDLLALGVRLIPRGTRVTVLTASDLTDARDREPAIWSCVIGAARRVAERHRAERRVR